MHIDVIHWTIKSQNYTSGRSRGGSEGSNEPSLEPKLFHFHGEFHEPKLFHFYGEKIRQTAQNEPPSANLKSKKISNDQELIQSDPMSCPQNQKGSN